VAASVAVSAESFNHLTPACLGTAGPLRLCGEVLLVLLLVLCCGSSTGHRRCARQPCAHAARCCLCCAGAAVLGTGVAQVSIALMWRGAACVVAGALGQLHWALALRNAALRSCGEVRLVLLLVLRWGSCNGHWRCARQADVAIGGHMLLIVLLLGPLVLLDPCARAARC
jgi:hypothetical protein